MRKIFPFISILVFLLPGIVQAQTDSTCGTLAAVDCSVLTESQAAMANLKSTAFNLQFSLHTANLPGGDVEALAIGSGAYQIDVPAWNSRLSFANPRAFISYLAEYLRGVGANLSLTFSLQAGSDVEAAALQIRMADSVIYVNLNGLRSLIGDSASLGWIGIDLEAFMRLMLDQDATVFNQFLKGTDFTTTNGLDTSGWVTISRLKSAEPGIAVFETRLRLSDMLDDPLVSEAYRQQLQAMQGSSAQADMLLPLMQLIVGESEIVVQQRVRLTDHYLQSFDLSYAHDLDRFTQGMLFPDATGEPPLHFDFNYHVDYSRFDDAPPITAPDDVFEVFDYDSLRRLMAGSGAPL